MAAFADRYLRYERGPKGSKTVLWPVYAWPVYFPTPRRNQLDLFQEAILGLMRAGVRQARDIGDLLALDAELVAFIISATLIPEGWTDRNGRLTEKGERVLETGNTRADDMTRGVVFQDAVTLRLWPRFSRMPLEEIEALEQGDSHRPRFMLNRTSGFSVKPFLVEGARPWRSTPTASDIFEAFREFLGDANRRRGDGGDELAQRVRSGDIRLASQNPEPYYLWVDAYRNPESSYPWLIADPFGYIDAAPWLRHNVARKLDGSADGRPDAPLAGYLKTLYDKSETANDSFDAYFREIDERVNLELMAKYPGVTKDKRIAEQFATVLRVSEHLRSLGRHVKSDAIDSLMSENQKLGEVVLKQVYRQFTIPGDKVPVAWKYKQLRQAYAAMNLAFLDQDALDALPKVPADSVNSAIDRNGDVSLKACVALNVFSAWKHSGHPFNSMTAADTGIGRLIALANDRNLSSHASDPGRGKNTADKALAHADFITAWAAQFTNWY